LVRLPKKKPREILALARDNPDGSYVDTEKRKQQVFTTVDKAGIVSVWLNGNVLELTKIEKYEKSAQVMERKEAAYVATNG